MRTNSHHAIAETRITPQSLLLAFLGMQLLGKQIAVSSGSVVEVFSWLGVGQSATRSLLARMCERGMLDRYKDGRKTYYSLTPRGSAVLNDGSRKVWRGTEQSEWDGQWTTIAMSVPEDARHLRHRARSRLGWSGFGYTSSGLWVAPGKHNVVAILGTEFEEAALTVVIGRAELPTTDADMVTTAFDLDRIAETYNDFVDRWSGIDIVGSGEEWAYATRIRLHADWLSIGRSDPLLPKVLLPNEWPADIADRLFKVLDAELRHYSSTIDTEHLPRPPRELSQG